MQVFGLLESKRSTPRMLAMVTGMYRAMAVVTCTVTPPTEPELAFRPPPPESPLVAVPPPELLEHAKTNTKSATVAADRMRSP